MIYVYHVQRSKTREMEVEFPKDFQLVAKVDCAKKENPIEELEDAYFQTNHINYNWQENVDIVEALPAPHARSSSIGDVFVMANETRDIYRVAGMGFDKVEKAGHGEVIELKGLHIE